MAQKKKPGNTVAAVTALCEPFARQLGLSLWDVRFEKEGSYHYLRIFIDKPQGVTLDDCEALSRAINDPLDRLDPIDTEYCLEVCSPGIDRDLVRPAHFEAYLGAVVHVRLIRPLPDGVRDITAVLQDYDNGVMRLETQNGDVLDILKKETAFVKACDDDMDIEQQEIEEEL